VKIQPISQYVIVKLDPADEKIGELYTAATMPKYAIPKRTGTIKAAGRGLVTATGAIVPMQVKPGDRVYVIETIVQGTKIENKVTYDGDECIVLSDESHIIGIITEEGSLSVSDFGATSDDASVVLQ